MTPRQRIRERFGLTEMESRIAILVAEGLSNEIICERLDLKRATVASHLRKIKTKLGLIGEERDQMILKLRAS